ncbi:MAG: T9SS type A sorting domain-containing protein [Ignavibacteriae bacterium]|nr:T9SS type A sorting domain-containing protein [Ignavibacteriota bacterium]
MSLFLILTYSHAQNIKLISPNGKEILSQNSRYSITWNSNDVKTISLYYTSDDENWVKIDQGISSDLRSYSWKVPQINKPIKIKIFSEENKEIFDVSDKFVFINNNLSSNIFSFQKKTIDPVRILPLGNSITFDNRKDDTRVVEDKIGYRFPLFNLLQNKGYSFEFIGSEHAGFNFFSNDENAGFPGIRSSELANLLITGRRYQPFYSIDQQITSGPYLETYNPNIILIHSGTNNNDNPVDGTIPEYMEQILDEIDRYEQDNNVEVIVILAKIIDRVPNQNYVNTLNNNVEEMALDRVNNPLNDAYPDKIIIVDMENGANIDYAIDTMGTIGNGIYGDMNDALHPNDKGYQKMANVWFEAIDSILDSPILINKHPISLSVIENNTVEFLISASSSLPLTYQWKKNGLDLVGENDSVLTIENVGVELNESEFICQLSTWGKTLESNSAFLNVTAKDLRVSSNLQVLYSFSESSGKIIHDNLEVTNPLDLSINSTSNYEWFYNSLKISNSSHIQSIDKPSKLFNSIISTNELTVELWIKPQSAIQNGPARIITYSPSRFERNFGLLQNGDRYEFRLRTTATDNNGIPSIITDAGKVTENLTHIVYTLSSEDTAKLYLNGVLEKTMHLNGTFDNWDANYSFGIANEFNDDKPWFGTYYLTAIYDRSLTNDEILHNYSIGVSNFTDMEPPQNLNIQLTDENEIELTWEDTSLDELGFVILRKDYNQLSFELIDSISSNSSTYIDNTAVEGIKYEYCIVSYNSFGISESSNIVNIYKPLPNPINLSGTNNLNGQVELTWEDKSSSEIGFIIETKPAIQDSIYKIIGTVNANEVIFTDTTNKFYSPYVYRVYAFTTDTNSLFSNEFIINVVDIKDENLYENNEFELYQNYPNPFNPTTNIVYSISEDSKVSLTIYNVLGQELKKLVDQVQSTGKYQIIFDAKDLPTGIYYYLITATSISTGKVFDNCKKLTFIK